MAADAAAQDAFLNAKTLAELTTLSIDDLEAQCLGPRSRMKALMADWVKVETARNRAGETRYRLCGVCLGGATLVNRGWIDPGEPDLLADIHHGWTDPGNPDMLAEIHDRSADAVVSGYPEEITERVCAIDRIRRLNVGEAMELAFDGDLGGPDRARRNKDCERLEKMFRKADEQNRLDPARARAEGTNQLSGEGEISPADIAEGIRFFRKIVIPALRSAGL